VSRAAAGDPTHSPTRPLRSARKHRLVSRIEDRAPKCRGALTDRALNFRVQLKVEKAKKKPAKEWNVMPPPPSKGASPHMKLGGAMNHVHVLLKQSVVSRVPPPPPPVHIPHDMHMGC
jgi:hypothetical protein